MLGSCSAWVWGSLAVVPCFHQLFKKALNTEGGCLVCVAFLAAGALVGLGRFELPEAALLLEAEFLLWLMPIQIFPCKIPIALRHAQCSGVMMPDSLPALVFGSSSAQPPSGLLFPPLWKLFLGSLFLLPTHMDPVSVNEELPWSRMN